jgi:Uncharacterized protein conserved in bacteria (DUF2169)
MGYRRVVVAETRPPIDPAGYRPRWSFRSGAEPPPPGRDVRLPVGVLRWNNPAPSLTVIVRMELTFGPRCETDGEAIWAELAAAQPGLSGTVFRAEPEGSREIDHPHDFVPWKRRADVLLKGHAYAPLKPSSAVLGGETTRIEAGFSVDTIARSFSLIAAGATDRIPLRPEHLRANDGAEGLDPVGPMRDPPLVPDRWHQKDFDYTHYNAASPLQQLASVAPDALIRLNHLSPRAEERIVLLPGLAPRVFLNTIYGSSAGEIDMDCDTLILDTDREAITLIFRGDVVVDSLRAENLGRLVVSLERAAEARHYTDITRELPRGHFFFATEIEDVAEGAEPVPEVATELTMARYESWGHERAPDPTLSLPRYAAVSAELAEQREPRGDVLERHGLDEDRWTLEERAWGEILALHGAEAEGALAIELSRLTVAAQEDLASPEEERRTLADYARLLAAMEKRDPASVLAGEEMTLPQWMRLDRRFGGEVSRDEGRRDELERLLEIERAKASILSAGAAMQEEI